MAIVEVYNTTNNLVVYGDGQVLGGLERIKVEESLIADALKSGAVRIARPRPAVLEAREPVQESVQKAATPSPVVDGESTKSDVPLNAAKPSGTAEEKSSVDEGSTAAKPATIRKTRRPRKSSVKE